MTEELPDRFESDVSGAETDSAFSFSEAELAVYGFHQLDVLEEVLSKGNPDQLFAARIAIGRKIGRIYGVDDERPFLEAYCRQLRARLDDPILAPTKSAAELAGKIDEPAKGWPKWIWWAGGIFLLVAFSTAGMSPSATGDAGQVQQSATQVSPAPPSPSSNFKRVNLPRGVSLDVPKGWWVLDDEFTRMLHTSTEAVMDLTGMPLQEGTETDLIRANSMPRSTFAAVAVTSLVPPSGQPDELRALGSAELSELAGYLKTGLGDVLAKQGWQLLSEVSVQVSSMSGYPALISEYRRTGPKGPVSVQVIQIMTGRQEVKITLSFREAEAAIWSPVIEKIRRSIVVNEHASGNLGF